MKAYITEKKDEFTESRRLLTHLCREGHYDEARVLIHSLETNDTDRRVWAANNLAFLARQNNDYAESLRIHLATEPLILQCEDDETRANGHLGMAITLEVIGEREKIESYFDRAFIEFEAARFFFHDAEQYGVASAVDNNIANLLIKTGRPEESHTYLQRAREGYKTLDRHDRVYRLAEVDNTEAESYLAENNPQEAVHFAQLSVDALRHGDEPQTLAKSIETLEKALQALKDFNRTQLTAIALREAGSVAKAAVKLGISRTAVEKRIEQHPELEIYARRGKPRGVNACA